MNAKDSTRKLLLKPIVRRQSSPSSERRIYAAIRGLEERALASSLLPEMVAEQKKSWLANPKGRWKNAEMVKSQVRFTAALYLARRISLQEYTFFVAHAAEGLHDNRIIEGAYPELTRLSASMRKIEVLHGLSSDEYWTNDAAPPEFLAASSEWDSAAHDRLGETLVELEGSIIAEMFHNDQQEFDRLRERGRRSLFNKNDLHHALADTIKRYEVEARKAAECKAYAAAVTLLGASMEGLLLMRCLRSKSKACKVARTLSSRSQPRDLDSPVRWTFDNLIQVCLQAGWLPLITTPAMTIRPDGLAHRMRQMRNLIHPGKVCVERPWVEAEHRDFEDADTIYTTLFATVFKGAALKRYGEIDSWS